MGCGDGGVGRAYMPNYQDRSVSYAIVVRKEVAYLEDLEIRAGHGCVGCGRLSGEKLDGGAPGR